MHQHDEKYKKDALHRIKIIQGHLAAIEQMLERDEYCVDIVHQSMAVQRALKKLDMVVIKNHLEGCMVDQVKNGEEAQTVSELLKLYEMK